MAKSLRTVGRPIVPDSPHRRVAAEIRERMVSGDWPAGAVLPSWRALSRELRVGMRTVRLAVMQLRQEGRIAPTAQNRRLTVVDPNSPGLTLQHIYLEVLTTNPSISLASPLFAELQRGIEMGVGKLMSPLLLAHDDRLRHHMPHEVFDLPVRGIVIAGQATRAALRQYEKLAVPVVLADRPPGDLKLHSACVDNEAAAMDAVNRLLALGHRRIAFQRFVPLAARDVDEDSKERQRGYERALKSAGLRPDRNAIFSRFTKDTFERASIQAIFKAASGSRRTLPFTAVLSADPGGAQLVERAAAQRGIHVPRDMSIACFQPLEAGQPHFSGPQIDFRALGMEAGLLLKEKKSPMKVVRVKAPWVDGRTVARAP